MDIDHLWNIDDTTKGQQNTRCLSVNTILAGKYLVGPLLGQGGFGITYQGYDLNMETRIAIKEYFPVELVSRDTTTMTGDRVLSLGGEKSTVYQQGLQKYVDEARNVSQFSQIPGVVSVKDFFYENETAYIVMEYIEGQSLKDYLRGRGGRLSEEEALRIMKPVLEALGKVHEAGIIHRDISPDNIMLTFDAEASEGSGDSGSRIQNVKLIDFGAARMTAKNDQKSLTIILKHGYAPEEQYRTHGEQGPWTDVYAVCAVLYRMMTGETPVPAMDRLFQDELKNFEAQGVNVSAGTAEAVLKGLAVKKEDRIQDMQELIGALYEGTKIRRTGKNGKRKVYAAAGVCAAVVLAVVGIAAGFGSRRNTNMDVSVTQEGSPMEETESLPGESVQLSEGETLGEQIVFYTPQRSISASDLSSGHILFCLPDGTVEARGRNEAGQCDVEDWTHVAAVCAAGNSSYGLRTDGTVLYAGEERGLQGAELWTDVIDLQASTSIAVGLHSDGTVSAVSNLIGRGMIEEEMVHEINAWTDIRAVALTVGEAAGLREDGTLLLTGYQSGPVSISGWEEVTSLQFYGNYYEMTLLLGIGDGKVLNGIRIGETEEGNADQELDQQLLEFQQLEPFRQMSVTGAGYAGIGTDGALFCDSWTREQLGTGIEDWSDLQAVQWNIDEIYGLTTDGTILEYWKNQGNAEPETMSDLQWVQAKESSTFDDIVACTRTGEILTYGKTSMLGAISRWEAYGDQSRQYIRNWAVLYKDGTFTYRDHRTKEYVSVPGIRQAVELWQGGAEGTCAYLLLQEDGTISIQKGAGNWEDPNLQYEKEMLDYYAPATEWTDITQIALQLGRDLYALQSDGTVRVLFIGSPSSDEQERELELEEKIVGVYAGAYSYGSEYMVLGLTEQGTVKILKEEERSRTKGMLQVENWTDITQIAIGESHTVGLRSDGTVAATGRNYAGQCDVEDWTDIVYLTAGRTCTLGITADGTLKMAGSLY